MKRQNKGALLARHGALILGAFTVIIPFLWMLTTSLQSRSETYTSTAIFPTSWHWENYMKAWEAAPFGQYYVNSALMSLGIVLGHLVFDAMAAYAFARLRFPAKILSSWLF